ncbi:MAG: hypothetical protein CM1200mP2_40160 [Planctomycetaceae bacterium]|nr:MAG: hypothetical protein CM1200mP2_40160 [Planctomycetaceae bacterium]
MIGVVKAYTTRVGGGPFPTELDNEIGQHIRDEGNEYGTVTGRPRRCGWFDAVATGYGARLSGVDCLAVMLLDVLGKLEEVQVCEAYEFDGERTTDFPAQLEDLARARRCEINARVEADLTGIRKLEDLPAGPRGLPGRGGRTGRFPVDIVSVGPDREQTTLVDRLEPVAATLRTFPFLVSQRLRDCLTTGHEMKIHEYQGKDL